MLNKGRPQYVHPLFIYFYNSKTDFVIDLDNVWKQLGFSSKHKTKELLEKNFIVNKDYKSLLSQAGEQKKPNFAFEASGAKTDTRGGHNKETIMLNIQNQKLAVCNL